MRGPQENAAPASLDRRGRHGALPRKVGKKKAAQSLPIAHQYGRAREKEALIFPRPGNDRGGQFVDQPDFRNRLQGSGRFLLFLQRKLPPPHAPARKKSINASIQDCAIRVPLCCTHPLPACDSSGQTRSLDRGPSIRAGAGPTGTPAGLRKKDSGLSTGDEMLGASIGVVHGYRFSVLFARLAIRSASVLLLTRLGFRAARSAAQRS